MKQKYFIVEDRRIADTMRLISDINYYAFFDKTKNKEVYTFEKTKEINKIYGKAMTISELYYK